MIADFSEDVTFTAARTDQCVAYFIGDGSVIHIDDGLSEVVVHLPPIQRAVMVARLRAIADVIEAGAGS